MALLIPFAAGLFGLSLQGGLLISDQVNLQHYALAGALWTEHNLATATTDGGTAGTITGHVISDICGGAGARYCGNGSLTVTATAAPLATSLLPRRPRLGGVAGVFTGCALWHLDVSLAPAGVAQGGTATATVTLHVDGAGATPGVALSASGYPPGSAGPPLFTPPSLGADGATATLPVVTTAATAPGTYSLRVGGADQCGIGPAPGLAGADLTVTGSAPAAPCAAAPTVFTPAPNAVTAGSQTSVTIPGAGFSTGTPPSVAFGATPAAGVTVASASAIVATLPAGGLPAGIYDLTVTNNPSGCAATLLNGLTVAAAPTNAAPPPPPSAYPCAQGAGPPQKVVITITWNEDLIIPWLTPTFPMKATQVAYCQG
jgi:hypothetical protein